MDSRFPSKEKAWRTSRWNDTFLHLICEIPACHKHAVCAAGRCGNVIINKKDGLPSIPTKLLCELRDLFGK